MNATVQGRFVPVGFGLAIPDERPRRDAPKPSGSARNVQPVLLAG